MALKNLFQLSTFEFIHRRFNTTSEHIDGMNAIYEAIEEFEFSNSVFPMTQEYANWETDAVKIQIPFKFTSQCLKITQNVAFEFLPFGIFPPIFVLLK